MVKTTTIRLPDPIRPKDIALVCSLARDMCGGAYYGADEIAAGRAEVNRIGRGLHALVRTAAALGDGVDTQPLVFPACSTCDAPFILRRGFNMSEGGKLTWAWFRDCKHKNGTAKMVDLRQKPTKPKTKTKPKPRERAAPLAIYRGKATGYREKLKR